MIIIRFIRKDFLPPEEYYYNHICDAIYHLSLFENDDTDYYEKIQMVVELSNDKEEVILERLPQKKSVAK